MTKEQTMVKKPTKAEVRNRVNRLVSERLKSLAAEIDRVLVDADMWYGDDEGAPAEEARRWIVNRKNAADRNGDQLVRDGRLDTAKHLLTREELFPSERRKA